MSVLADGDDIEFSNGEYERLSLLMDSEDNINLSLYGHKVELTCDEKRAFSFSRGMLVSDAMLIMVRATKYFIEKYKKVYAPEDRKCELNENIKVSFLNGGEIKRSVNCLGCYTTVHKDGDFNIVVSEKISYYAEMIYDMFLKGLISELGGCNVVIHEVSHYIDRVVNGNNTHPNPNTTHGRDWSKIVNQLGGTDEATLDTKEESKSKILKVYIYTCVSGCESEVHLIKNGEHGRLIKKERVSRCKKCKVKIKYSGIEFVLKDGKITNDLSGMDFSKIVKFYKDKDKEYRNEVNSLKAKADDVSKRLRDGYSKKNKYEVVIESEEIDM